MIQLDLDRMKIVYIDFDGVTDSLQFLFKKIFAHENTWTA